MVDEQRKKVFFYVTGFGKFGPILENPTTYLVRDLPSLIDQVSQQQRDWHLEHHEIVDVTIQECDIALDRIFAMVAEKRTQADHHVVINFGVAANRGSFCLENIGKNIADFIIPDEGGN